MSIKILDHRNDPANTIFEILEASGVPYPTFMNEMDKEANYNASEEIYAEDMLKLFPLSSKQDVFLSACQMTKEACMSDYVPTEEARIKIANMSMSYQILPDVVDACEKITSFLTKPVMEKRASVGALGSVNFSLGNKQGEWVHINTVDQLEKTASLIIEKPGSYPFETRSSVAKQLNSIISDNDLSVSNDIASGLDRRAGHINVSMEKFASAVIKKIIVSKGGEGDQDQKEASVGMLEGVLGKMHGSCGCNSLDDNVPSDLVNTGITAMDLSDRITGNIDIGSGYVAPEDSLCEGLSDDSDTFKREAKLSEDDREIIIRDNKDEILEVIENVFENETNGDIVDIVNTLTEENDMFREMMDEFIDSKSTL